MIKLIAALGLAVFLVACEPSGSTRTGMANTDNGFTPVECLGGVEYYVFNRGIGNGRTSYMSVKFNTDSTVSTC